MSAQQDQEREQGREQERERLRLLIVEDRPEDVELMLRALREDGLSFESRVVDSPLKFSEALLWPPDVVLSDYRIPGFGALIALEMLREQGIAAPCIVVSGSIGEELAVDTIRKGAVDYVLKDRLGRLPAAIRAHSDRARVERERDESVRSLKELQETISWALKNTKIAIWDWKVASDRVAVSASFAKMLGYSPGEIVPSIDFLLDSIHPEDLPTFQSVMAGCLEGASDYLNAAFRMRSASGEWIWVECFGTVRERDEQGAGSRIAGVNIDITDAHALAEEARSLQNQLIHAQKMEAIGKLAGGVAHDFNNLLTVINGFCDLMLDADTEPRFREDLEEIRRAGEKAAQLTRQLLVLSRRQVTQPDQVELGPFIQQSVRILQRLLPENVELSVSLDCEDTRVFMDSTHLDQVLLNLIVNSRDALSGAEHGSILLEVTKVDLPAGTHTRLGRLPVGPYAKISVTDDGAGIAARDLDRIFEPFFTTKGKEEGTGLGLSTVYAIVQQAGGGIAIDSRPGAGARFDVFLPTVDRQAPTAPSLPQRARASLPASGRVLVVEDDPNVRSLIHRFLGGAGLEADLARSFDEGLKLIEQGGYALVVSDVVLPERSGVEFEAELAKRGLDIPLLLITGHVDEVFTQRQPSIQAPVLEKPFTRIQFLEKVGALLSLSGWEDGSPAHDEP